MQLDGGLCILCCPIKSHRIIDVARPTVVTTSRSPTYAKSSWTPKVNPFLYASPLPTLLNGILLHSPSYDHDRFTPTSTETREEPRGLTPDKTEAWKRRRKKLQLESATEPANRSHRRNPRRQHRQTGRTAGNPVARTGRPDPPPESLTLCRS